MSATKQRNPGRHLSTAVTLLLSTVTLCVVALLAMGRVEVTDAIFFAAAPWALLAAAFRPDWLLLGLIALPANFTASIQTNRVLLLVGVALVAEFISRKKFSLGLSTGLVALVVLVLAGHLFQADVQQDALAVNQEAMLSLTYYGLLALLALNLALVGDLDGERLGTALVLGVASTLVVGLAGYGSSWFEAGPGIISHTYLAYMAAAAFGVSLVRLLMPEKDSGVDLGTFLTAGMLLSLTILSLVRAAWLAVAISSALIAFRSGRRGFVLILAAAILFALFLPLARQEISRSQSGDIVAQLRSGDITTGRWRLWTGLWEQAQPALPWGNGFGFMWSLSSEDLLGVPDQFRVEESGVVPPHNDFMYLLVEFGIPGVLLLTFFWVRLFQARALLTESVDPLNRRSGWLLLGMLVTGLMVSLVDDVLSVRPFAERFFPVAGFLFGLAQLERARRRQRAESESLSEVRGLASLS